MILTTWESCEFKELLISRKLLEIELYRYHFWRLCFFELFGAEIHFFDPYFLRVLYYRWNHPFLCNEKTGLQGVIWFGEKGFCTRGETIRFCATKKTGLQGVIWLVAKKLDFEFQNFKNDDFLTFSFNFSSVMHFFYVIDFFFEISCPKEKIRCNNFNSKNAFLRRYSRFSKIQMKLILVSDQFHWNWSETKIKCRVSVKLGTKKRAFLA